MDFKLIKADLEKQGKLVVAASDKDDPYKVFVPDRAKLKVTQVSGSTAGAGSGDFHVYRGSRRRERFRIAKILEEADKKEKFEAFMKRKEEAYIEQTTRTAKKAAKRKRRKENQKKMRKKAKGEAKNQFNNDGSFLERFRQQQECAVTDLPPAMEEEIKSIDANKKLTAKKPGKWKSKKESHVPVIEAEGDDIIITVKHKASEDSGAPGGIHRVEFIYVKSDGKILGAKKFTDESANKEDFPRVRFKDLPKGQTLVAYAYCNLHGLWKSEPYEVKSQRENRLSTAPDLEGLGMKLCTLLEQEAASAIKDHGKFTVAFSGDVAEVVKASKIKCQSKFSKWHVFTTDDVVGEDTKESADTKDQIKGSVVEPWGVPEENFHTVDRTKSADDAAFSYSQEIMKVVEGLPDPQFDLIVVKLGKDGSFSSLRPGSEILQNSDVLVAPNGTGVGFTIPLFENAKKIAILVTKKWKSLSKIFEDEKKPMSKIPAGPRLIWFALDGSSL